MNFVAISFKKDIRAGEVIVDFRVFFLLPAISYLHLSILSSRCIMFIALYNFFSLADQPLTLELCCFQSTYGGRGPDVTFVTSRLVIAPLAEGIPEALASQAEDAMRLSILEQARGQFAIYNLSQRWIVLFKRMGLKSCFPAL